MPNNKRNKSSALYKKEVVNKQLGLSYSTVRARLYKNMLYSLVVQLDKNHCYRCQKPITSAEELSLDHKVDWLHGDNPVEVYMDLDNVGFSHNKCNILHNRRANKHKESYKKGLAWCRLCKSYSSKVGFSKNKNNISGVQHICKVHAAALEKERKLKETKPCENCRQPISVYSSKLCLNCFKRQIKSERSQHIPSKEALEQDLQELLTCKAIAKKYSVTEMTVGNWKRRYEIYKSRR